MQVKQLKSEGLSRELEVTVPANDIQAKRENRLKEVGKTVKMDGFRPGKVPMNVLEKRYGRAIMGEVLEAVVNDTSAQALSKENIRPAQQPKIEVKEFDEGKDLIYTIAVEILPEFAIADVSGLKIEKPIAKIEDKQIDESLERISSHHSGSKAVEEDRATKEGDIVVMDFSGRTKDDNVEHAGMKAEGHKLELGSGQFIPGFEDQLVGKNKGDKVEVNVGFPENYAADDLAGREAIFDVTIHEIHEKAPVEINDEFAATLGFDDEKALRDAVKHQLSTDYAQQTRMKMKRQLLDFLDEKHDFDIPQGMMDAELETITSQVEQERKMSGNEDEITQDEKDELEAIAERRVRLGLVIAEIGSVNGVKINDQELQQAVIAEAQKYPGQEKEFFDFYQQNPQAQEGLRAGIFEDKVVDYLFEEAEVTEKEVSIDELMAEDDEPELKPKKKAAKKSAKKSTKKSAKKSAKKSEK